MAVFALCAKDPVKERRAHARQCLVKNVNIRREYLKQHAALSGKEVRVCRMFGFYQLNLMSSIVCVCIVSTDKLLSLLPEYVVPYTIHLLAHDPDYIKVSDIEQLKDIKE